GTMEVGAGVTLTYNPSADVNTDLVNLIMARGNHEQAKQVKATRRSVLLQQLEEVTKLIRGTRDVFKLSWGTQFCELFTALGFSQGTLEMPTSLEDMIGMLQSIKTHLTANPTQEVVGLVTAARAQTLLDALMAAQQAIVAQDVVIGTMMEVRDEKFDTLRKRISGVYQELRMQLGPLDQRWGNFGFNLPGADETPDQVTGLKVTLIGPTAAATKWDASARAGYYRVYIRVLGVDADYRAIGSPADLDFTIENLPANATVDVVVTAVNNGGEGARSEVIRIVTH
ncbi:MAG: family lipolytic protein, partial [Verrucomicrobiales bacterium]|nr:family lipolytic protein [Verrucomicrobiales bacterium]